MGTGITVPVVLCFALMHLGEILEGVSWRDEAVRPGLESQPLCAPVLTAEDGGQRSNEIREGLEKTDMVCSIHHVILFGVRWG